MFIYPIYDSELMFLLVIFPNDNGKWIICVDHEESNKSAWKDHFPLPFIDQFLDVLVGWEGS